MTDPQQDHDVEQRLAEELDPERHAAPSEGIPQGLGEEPPDEGQAT